MFSTAKMSEMQMIVDATHGNPHTVLGMHEIEYNGKNCLCVRAFIPQADTITVKDPKNPKKLWELTKIHADGFFEGIIKERSKWFRYILSIECADGNAWETYDAYSFAPVISSLDLHLFGQGTHYRIYEKLGAHPMTIDGVDGVLFAVWAPHALRVSVIGNFNQWDGRRNLMRMLETSGVWELFIPGLSTFDEYKYEIKTGSGSLIQKADPYASFDELRPSTSSLVYDLRNYQWHDAKWIENREKNSPLDGPMNVYEVHLGSWDHHESGRMLSYLELSERLIPYVKEMGYTHIELMPIEEHPFDGSWGYQVTGYYAPTSRYGTPDEFRTFVDLCHQNGIGIILDWVPAHFPKDAHGLARFDGTCLYEHADPRQGEHPEWGTLIYNYGCNEVKNFLIANAIYWIEEFHLDGLRVDAVASMLYLDYAKSDGQWIPNKYGGNHNLEAVEFLKHMNSVIGGAHPNVILAAEESTSWAKVSRPTNEGGLGFNLKWNMGWMNDFLKYIAMDPIYRRYHHNNLTFGLVYAYTENFILVLSHDEVVHGKKSMLDKMPGDLWQKCANLRAAYGFMFGHPGKKLLFMGGEFGQFIEWDEKRPLDWFLLEYPHHKQIQDYCRDLNHLYREERALWYDDFGGSGFEWIDCNDASRSLLTFIRRSDNEDETLIFMLNFTPNPVMDYRVGLPFNRPFVEIMNSDDAKYGGGGITNDGVLQPEQVLCNGREYSLSIKLPPLAVSILKVAK